MVLRLTAEVNKAFFEDEMMAVACGQNVVSLGLYVPRFDRIVARFLPEQMSAKDCFTVWPRIKSATGKDVVGKPILDLQEIARLVAMPSYNTQLKLAISETEQLIFSHRFEHALRRYNTGKISNELVAAFFDDDDDVLEIMNQHPYSGKLSLVPCIVRPDPEYDFASGLEKNIDDESFLLSNLPTLDELYFARAISAELLLLRTGKLKQLCGQEYCEVKQRPYGQKVEPRIPVSFGGRIPVGMSVTFAVALSDLERRNRVNLGFNYRIE